MRVSKTVRFAPWLALLLTLGGAAGCDDDDDPVVAVDPNPPVAGSGLTFTSITSSSLTVSWGAATDDRSAQADLAYKLVRASAASDVDTIDKVDALTGSQVLVDYLPGVLTRNVSGLEDSKRYFFALVVRDQAGNKTLYPSAMQTTLDGSAPALGTGISFSNLTATSVVLSWGPASDTTTAAADLEYKLVRALSAAEIDTIDEVLAITNGPDELKPFTKNLTTAEVTGLSTSTNYAFAVVVRDAAGNRALYAPASVITTDVTPPTPGSGIAFTDVTTTSLTVSWGAATDAATEAAKLKYKLVSAANPALIDTLAEADAIVGPGLIADFTEGLNGTMVAGLSASSSYAFAVVVVDAADNRALYAPAAVNTLDVSAPTPGSALTFSGVTATSLTVSWGAGSDDVTAAGQLQYKLVTASRIDDIDTPEEVAQITEGSSLIQDFTPGLTSKTLTGLQSSTAYAFAVAVRDAAGNESVYSPASQRTIDDTTPVAGSAISFSDVGPSSLTVTWGKANDNVTARPNLRYKLVKALVSSSINTIGKVEAITGADLLIDYASDVARFDLTGLVSSSSLTFAVIVRDEAGNRTLYAPATVSTLDISAPEVGTDITFGPVSDTAITLQWGAAEDDVSAPAALEYKAVIAPTVAQIDTLAEVEAIISGPSLLLDYTAAASSAQATGLVSSTDYAFAVVVRDQAGNRALYTPAARSTLDVTPPVVGTPVNFASIAATAATVRWGAATDDVTAVSNLQYKVVRAATSAEIDTLAEADAITGLGLVQDFTANLNGRAVTGLTSSSSYTFAVVVRDQAGNRALYAPQTVTTVDVSAPTPGLALSFSAVTANSMTVDWGAATDDVTAAGDLTYKLVTAGSDSDIDTLAEIDAITGGPGLLFDYTPNLTTYAALGLTSSTSYAYAVAVRDQAGNRSLYAPGTQATTDITPPTIGSGIIASNVSSNSLQLDWGDATDDLTAQADLSYRVVTAPNAADIDTLGEAAAISGAGIVQNNTTALVSLPVSGLSSGTTYAFAVIVRDVAGNEALYAPITQTTLDVVAPTPGTAISFTNVTSSSVTVNWGAASDDITALANLEYKVVRAASTTDIDTIAEVDALVAAPDRVLDYTTNATNVSATGLTPLTTYAFAVLVRDQAGNRALYTPQTVFTPDGQAPTPGTEIRFSSVTSTGFNISWGAATDNATAQASIEYRVVRAATSTAIDQPSEVNAITGGDLLQDWTANLTGYVVTGLSAGTFYHYAIGVRDSAQNVAVYTPNSRVTGPILYRSSTRVSSNLGGPSGADTFCGSARDRRASTNASVKAVLATPTRRACVTGNCTNPAENIDWVFHPNTIYYNTNGSSVGTTNSAGIFSFPLNAAWVPGNSGYTHSALNSNWTSNASNCSGFTDDTSTAYASMGYPSYTDVSAIWAAYATCANSAGSLSVFVTCVEQ